LTDDEFAPEQVSRAVPHDAAAPEFAITTDHSAMTISQFVFAPEEPAHDAEIEEINAEAFGPGRFTRAAQRIREGGPHDRRLSFVALSGSNVIGSVRQTPVKAGGGRALLLGPLAVRPAWKNIGIGRRLMAMALDAAKKGGWPAVVLVGDEPYYGPLGFNRMPRNQISLPGPVDPNRVLAHEIEPGAVARLKGMLDHEERAKG
jgi:predicted N-acetyltransferase YhbS